MQNLTDDELDKIFRKAAEELKPEYNHEHWKELDAKLDQPKTGGFFNNRWTWSILAVLLITSAIVFINLDSTSNSDNGISENTPVVSEEQNVTNKDESPIINRADKTSSQETITPSVNGKSTSDEPSQTAEMKNPNFEDDSSDAASLSDVKVSKAQTKKAQVQSYVSNREVHGGTTKRNEDARTELKPNAAAPFSIEKSNDRIKIVSAENQNASESESRVEHIGTNEIVLNENGLSDTSKPSESIAVDHVVITKSAADVLNDESVSTEKSSIKDERDSKEKSSNLDRHDLISDKKENDRNNVRFENQEALPVQSSTGNGQGDLAVSQAAASDVQLDSVVKENQAEKIALADNSSDEDESSKDKKGISRFSLKLAVSPDFSAIKYSGYTKAGTNYGLLLQYQLSERFAISSGIISARKLYSASSMEYNGYVADKVDGDCRIIDIPVNVIYQFKSNGSLSFYSSIGISSYLMSSEVYDFHYSSYSYSKEVKGENNEMFSILNLSVGMQKQFSKRWALQVEPYVKQPLKGIGEGNLALSSVGAFVNLCYFFIR